MIALLLPACAPAADPGDGSLSAGRWRHAGLGLAVPVPPGWRATIDRRSFASGLDGVVLEAHGDGVDLALVAVPAPRWPLVARRWSGLGPLDAVALAAPDVGAPLQRLPACGGAVEQAGEDWVRVGVAARDALVLVHAWGGDAAARVEAARALACGAERDG